MMVGRVENELKIFSQLSGEGEMGEGRYAQIGQRRPPLIIMERYCDGVK